jgi:hypothetical protein
MTIRSAESVFGAMPETQCGTPSGGPIPDKTHEPYVVPVVAKDAQPESEAKWVNTELNEIATTIEQLQGRLDQANSRLSKVEQVEAEEVEIGRLFVESQQFIEAYLSKIEAKIHEVMSEAEGKARQILAEATEEAQAIRGEAQRVAFASTNTVRELQSAIAGFTTVNAELLKELGALNGMLSPGNPRTAVDFAPPLATSDPTLPTGVHSTETG